LYTITAMTIESLIQNLKNKDVKQADLDLINRAYLTAEQAHRGQKRFSGEDYIIHPLKTADFLTRLNFIDAPTIAAALLHDTVEDTGLPLEKIEKDFGPEVAFLINGITKLGKIKYQGVERRVENLRKMFLAMAEDIRVILIKLADRHHNMQTLDFVRKEKQKRIALETLEIYTPIAYRLGMGELKGQLEDLAFPYAYPDEHRWLMTNIKEKYQQRQEYLKKVVPMLERELKKENINAEGINLRAKHYYSLYQKLLRHEMNLEKIYDLAALRIVVSNIDQCYGALGVVHKLWRPLPDKIKDYIALPKPNGYQSIHTTVFCLDDKITEFQIRTKQMHEIAENGIAAHWAYSEAGKPDEGARLDEKKFGWVQQLREWQAEVSGTEEFLESLKIDFFKNRIFVLTPKGDVIDLPQDATPVDFAYHIHSEIGEQCAGAKVNGKIVPLNTPLQNSDIVEILIQKNKKPSEGWLDFIKTTYAKNKVKKHFQKKLHSFADRTVKNQTPQKAEIRIVSSDRVGLLKDISSILSSQNINIITLNTDSTDNPYPDIFITISAKDKLNINRLVLKLKEVKGVAEVGCKLL